MLRIAFLIASHCLGSAQAVDLAPSFDAEEQPPWAEAKVAPPEYPGETGLIEFVLDRPTANRYFVDPLSLSVADDGVVRFTLVLNARGGANSVTYEGIRCATRERRLYATGRAEKAWATARDSDWRPIELTGPNRYHAMLYKQFLCPNRRPIRSAKEGIVALKRGVHPDVRIEYAN